METNILDTTAGRPTKARAFSALLGKLASIGLPRRVRRQLLQRPAPSVQEVEKAVIEAAATVQRYEIELHTLRGAGPVPLATTRRCSSGLLDTRSPASSHPTKEHTA